MKISFFGLAGQLFTHFLVHHSAVREHGSLHSLISSTWATFVSQLLIFLSSLGLCNPESLEAVRLLLVEKRPPRGRRHKEPFMWQVVIRERKQS
ncbi:mCG1027169, isoform CRA_a [Mus musculus]|jgi:hypothetical protein|uniref:Uncharacterized protein n=1 Tax=Mus musculus TaxID=10090 RepID=Q3UT75_MOUSE|nr:mCG1027169, isoform CRA_a [Mus musculus]EDL10663.1 mCG1027169, isoform CRA_a [Mus musculus]BAE24105.1 unnamed protein product [Mus musculus]